MVQAGTQAKILGVSIADKVLFTHGANVPLHAKLTILGFVLISMATTYLTIRQSMKRGMMPAATPDNPMASSQKYMAYIMPFFALTGLYWPFGLVLYWVTTNVWTLGQQFLLAKRYPYTPPAPVDGAAPASVSPAAARSLTGGSGRQGATAGRGQQGTGRAAANGAGAKSTAPTAAGGSAKGGASAKGGSSAKRGTGDTSSATAGPDGASNGMLKRFSRGRTEPEPDPEPEVKLVRHQTQRQSRSKRSGKR